MEKRLDQLAELVGGKLFGAPDVLVRDANPPQLAQPTDITLIVHLSKHEKEVSAAAIVTPTYVETCDKPQLVVEDPHAAFATIVSLFRPPVKETLPGVGVDSSVSIASSAKVHPTATVCEDVLHRRTDVGAAGCRA